MVEVYINGCSSCGENASQVAKVKRAYPNAVIYNTKYDGAYQLHKHTRYLAELGINVDRYHAIVVEDDGKTVTLLKEWKS